ncbi:hypothetical protein Pan216_22750 [Planctomycetes bacterium Pan216]|uniref:SWIM-type domain-containing protein n=1 Tax=Kolteria novifilia TaxID=2527975 RepID=A0A518B355_9BACT|nr:hypothetical protein Pan216_22750 [Planctomycetes bacterium Pan216]
MIELTTEQVAALAPDEKAAVAGRKLGSGKTWRHQGTSDQALWGECQGSAVYQTKIDLSDLAYNCTCPSRKLPCKHVLGLLFWAATSPSDFPNAQPPDWVTTWLEKREATSKRREEKKAARDKPVDAEAQAKRFAKRHRAVLDGLERLDLWLKDTVRGGIAGLETKPPSYWESQAKRLVDAQAKGLAGRVRRMGEIPGTGVDWPQRLLAAMGRLALLTHAYRRLDELEEKLQADIRQLVGWTVSQDELDRVGESIGDRWAVVSHTEEEEERLRVRRNWLVGRSSGRHALVIQFAVASQPFGQALLAGTWFDGVVVFYPGAEPQRAMLKERRGELSRFDSALPGHASVDGFLLAVAESLARQPWLGRHLAILRNVVIVPRDEEPWLVVDECRSGLPLARGEHWQLLAGSGGHPVELIAEWDTAQLWPLGYMADGTFRSLGTTQR